VKELRASASLRFRHLDAHHAELEQAVDELARNARLLVHVANVRTDFAVGELVDAVAEQPFVFGQRRQREARRLDVVRVHGQ